MTGMEKMGLDTALVHTGERCGGRDGAVVPPIHTSSTYEFGGGDDRSRLKYIRLNNTPNQDAVAEKIARIEGAAACVMTASGMAAISTSLLALVPPGAHLLAQEDLYGGTLHFLQEQFPRLGREVSFFPGHDAGKLEGHLRANTRAVYVESVSNPLLRVPDLGEIARKARARGILSFIDNTFPSPVNFNPLALGFDVVLHSATKYLNGHTDLVAGCVVGSKDRVGEVRALLTDLGGSLDPHGCYLLNRGLKTLGLRVRHQGKTALALARFLEGHPRVEWVRYPGLESHPDHARARELFRGFGGMLSFLPRMSSDAVDAVLRKLDLAYVAPSLGGVETLVTRPAVTSHSWISAAERERLGLPEAMVRVSVGLEDEADLIADFGAALG